jgi:hypothetical protein
MEGCADGDARRSGSRLFASSSERRYGLRNAIAPRPILLVD